MSARKASKTKDIENDEEESGEERRRRPPARKVEEKKPDTKKARVTIPPSARNLYLAILIALLVLSFAPSVQGRHEATPTTQANTQARMAGLENATGSVITFLYNSFTELEIEPNHLYLIVFNEPGTSGWIDFHLGTAFDMRPTKEHILALNDGRTVHEYADKLSTVRLDKADKLRIQSPVAGNATWISTWAHQ